MVANLGLQWLDHAVDPGEPYYQNSASEPAVVTIDPLGQDLNPQEPVTISGVDVQDVSDTPDLVDIQPASEDTSPEGIIDIDLNIGDIQLAADDIVMQWVEEALEHQAEIFMLASHAASDVLKNNAAGYKEKDRDGGSSIERNITNNLVDMLMDDMKYPNHFYEPMTMQMGDKDVTFTRSQAIDFMAIYQVRLEQQIASATTEQERLYYQQQLDGLKDLQQRAEDEDVSNEDFADMVQDYADQNEDFEQEFAGVFDSESTPDIEAYGERVRADDVVESRAMDAFFGAQPSADTAAPERPSETASSFATEMDEFEARGTSATPTADFSVAADPEPKPVIAPDAPEVTTPSVDAEEPSTNRASEVPTTSNNDFSSFGF